MSSLLSILDDLISIVSNPAFQKIMILLGVIGSVGGGLRFWNSAHEWFRNRKIKRISESMEESKGVRSFTTEDIRRSLDKYVEPSCASIDPSDESDLRHVVALAPLFKSIDEHIAAGGEKRHVILLADSGMGKTSFCINYYSRELQKNTDQRRPIVIIPLGRPNALEHIKGIEEKRKTVLFLDAFDEDPKAVADKSARLGELMSASADCRNIIITCRSQFFANDDSIPKGSGVMYAGPRRAGQGREYPLHKLFLAPLTPEQIEVYLQRNFPYWDLRNWKLRKRARSLVNTIPELSVRPMLLELIPDLTRDSRAIHDLFPLYEFLIEKWLKRESPWISESRLLEISIEVAVAIFIRQRKGRGDRIAAADVEEIATTFTQPIEDWKLKSRSLLNRDIQGEFKFAHRSIMEYLFVVAALKGDMRCFTVEWTDFMKDLLASWGSLGRPDTERISIKLFSQSTAATKLQPFAAPLARPKLLSDSELRKIMETSSISTRHSRPLPQAWINAGINVEIQGDPGTPQAYKVEDSTHGLVWMAVDISGVKDLQDVLLYRDPFSRPHQMYSPNQKTEVEKFFNRLPSIHEMISLWHSEPYICEQLKIGTLLNQNEIYWLGDTLESGPLCCSFGPTPSPLPGVRKIVGTIKGNSRDFHLYAFNGQNGIFQGKAHKAMATYLRDTEEKPMSAFTS